MFLSILALISLHYAFSFKAGETFTYAYDSNVDTVASTAPDKITNVRIACKAKFKVISVARGGVWFSLVISNIESQVETPAGNANGQKDSTSEEYASKPLYFRLLNNGNIGKVLANTDDDTELVNLKTAIALTLQTHYPSTLSNLKSNKKGDFIQLAKDPVVDNIGKHYEYISVSSDSNSVSVSSSFSEDDFIQFSDKRLTKDQLAIDSDSIYTFNGDRIVSYTSVQRVIINNLASQSNSDSSDYTVITSSGRCTLNNYVQGPIEPIDTLETLESVSDFLYKHNDFASVSRFDSDYYNNNEEEKERKEGKVEFLDDVTCPGNIDVCKGFSKDIEVGNRDIGLDISAYALVGVTSGCSEEHRSYLASAEANLDLLILGGKHSLVKTYAEYWQVDGAPQRNAVDLSVFDKNVFHHDFPYLDCKNYEYPLGNYNFDHTFPYSITIYGITISFYVEAHLNLDFDVTATLCPMDFKASITFIPSVSVSVSAGVEVSVHLAKAGIALTGNTADHLDPTAYIDGNICRIGFRAANHLHPITASFDGYYQTINILKSLFHFSRKWGSKHKFNIWSHTWDGIDTTLIDVYYDANF